MYNKYFFNPALIFLLLLGSQIHGQHKSFPKKIIGGPCQGCEAIHEYGSKVLSPIDTLPAFQANEPKLKISGTVYQIDGKTPAQNVILYIYHTNRQGIYEKRENEKGWARQHGFIRGWVKTDEKGQYTFYTFQPAPYPNLRESAHIHITVKEPKKNEYYLDNYVFEGDPLLTNKARQNAKNRGGSGITKLVVHKGMLNIKRDLILGLNIPNYE